MMLMLVCVDDAVGRESRRAAIRMVNDDDILYSEQVLSDGNGPKSVDSATAGNDDRENGRR